MMVKKTTCKLYVHSIILNRCGGAVGKSLRPQAEGLVIPAATDVRLENT